LLLPQVASERGWDRTEFLRAICMKAGLPPNAWEKAELSVFCAEVFGESGE
jgi:AMMECR1 domain-containing protein